DRIHATVGCVADIALRSLAELIVPISIGEAFAHVGFESPGAYHGAIGGRLTSFHRFSDVFPFLPQCFRPHIALPLLAIVSQLPGLVSRREPTRRRKPFLARPANKYRRCRRSFRLERTSVRSRSCGAPVAR